ncbi:MAG: hypothetical protein IKL62_00640 [Clostridia bacterium]|nr:hypothetical protein [Clostridia bacterium]
MLKRFSALVLVLIFVFSLSACGGKEKTALERAKGAIERGNYEEAYFILYDIPERSEEEEELFNKFAFVPLLKKRLDCDGVETITKYEYNENGHILSDGEYTYSYTYNQDGNILTRTKKKDGYIAIDTYTYNGKDVASYTATLNGTVLSETLCTFYENGVLSSKTETSGNEKIVTIYDQNGATTSEKHTTDDVVTQEKTWTYDDNGNVLSDYYYYYPIQYLEPDVYWHMQTNSYNSENQLIKRELSGSNNFKATITYTYHSNSVLATETYVGNGGINIYTEPDGTYIRTHDENGNLLSFETRYNDGSWDNRKYTYYENNLTHTYHKTSSSGSDELTTYTYDENGSVLSETTMRNGKINDKHTYAYDEYGNMSYESEVGYTGFETECYWKCTYAEDGKLLSVKVSPADITCTYTYTNDTVTFNGYTFTSYMEPVTLVFDKFGNILSLTCYWVDPIDGMLFDYKEDISFELKYYPNGVPEIERSLYVDLDQSPKGVYRPPLTLYAISKLRGNTYSAPPKNTFPEG